jgi:hypothetical protein
VILSEIPISLTQAPRKKQENLSKWQNSVENMGFLNENNQRHFNYKFEIIQRRK